MRQVAPDTYTTTTEAAESSTQIVEIEETVDTPSKEAQQGLTLRTNTQQAPRQPALELPLATSPASHHREDQKEAPVNRQEQQRRQ